MLALGIALGILIAVWVYLLTVMVKQKALGYILTTGGLIIAWIASFEFWLTDFYRHQIGNPCLGPCTYQR